MAHKNEATWGDEAFQKGQCRTEYGLLRHAAVCGALN